MVKSLGSLEEQKQRGLVTCPYCDSKEVTRVLSRPSVKGGKKRGRIEKEANLPVASPKGPTKSELEKAYKFVSKLRANVEASHENVGDKFADEARAMHYGEKEERGIYGEASPREVKDLVEEGIEVTPLPALPKHDA